MKKREFKAWAIFDGEQLACFDYRLPLMWRRRLAREAVKRYDPACTVRPVLIREAPKRRSRHAK